MGARTVQCKDKMYTLGYGVAALSLHMRMHELHAFHLVA